MKKQSMRAAVVSGIGFLSLAVLAQGAFAFAPLPTTGRSFTSYLVRAYDDCTAPTLTVISNPNDPSAACLMTNVTTDDVPPGSPEGATMKWARLTVTKFPSSGGGQGKIQLVGVGFQSGQRVAVQLTLRTSHLAQRLRLAPRPHPT